MFKRLKPRIAKSLSEFKLHYEETPIAKKRGAVSRMLKQSRNSTVAPEVLGVLDYISTRQDTLISYEDIAQGSGVPKHRIGRIIKQLETEGTIVRSTPVPRKGTRYVIQRIVRPQSTGSMEEERVPEILNVEFTDFVNITNVFIKSFKRETRTKHDVDSFLTWLETLEEKDGI